MNRVSIFHPHEHHKHPVIAPIEGARMAAAGAPDPAALRAQMVNPDDAGEEIGSVSDDEVLEALRNMNEATRWVALKRLSDDDIFRLHARGWQ